MTARRLAGSAALFVVLLIAGAWPSDRVARAFSAAFCPLANLVVGQQTFGEGGHAHLAPLPAITRGAADNVTADTELALWVDGFAGALRAGVSLRRDVYLPLVLAIALLLAAPIPARRRLRGLSVAVPIVTAWALAVFQLLVLWTFATRLRGVYEPSGLQRRLIDLAYGALVLPPGNRFIVPIAVGGAIVAWQTRRDRRDAGEAGRENRHTAVAEPAAGERL